MPKFSQIALVLGAVSAHDKIDVFGIHNFKNLAQTLIRSSHLKSDKVAATGVVTWTQCADQAGDFQFDESSTTYSPNPIVKGTDLKLNLDGIVSDPMEITNIHVHVDWNGSTLYDEDLPQDNKYDSTYAYTVGWNVPSYAPSGHYDVTITGTGNAEGVTGTVMCVNAQMDL